MPETINETSIEKTGRVIRDVNQGVFCFIEVENRIALNHFNDTVISKVNGKEYDHVMLIDGNHYRGIDVGFMARKPFDIESIASQVDDRDAKGLILRIEEASMCMKAYHIDNAFNLIITSRDTCNSLVLSAGVV